MTLTHLDNMAAKSRDADDRHSARDYDLVLYGATSFVGKLTAAYLQHHLSPSENAAAADANQQNASQQNTSQQHASQIEAGQQALKPPIRWAIAGRNQQKLDALKAELGNAALATLLADSEQPDSLNAMAANTQVIISTVGPYLKYGEPLLKACVDNGTDYVDLTGEALFIKAMMTQYSDKAQQTGARIVNSCGFDSIPSDLGVLFTQNFAKQSTGNYCDTINMRLKTLKGGLSGGTIASVATVFTAAAEDKFARKQLRNPYILNDDPNPPTAPQNHINQPQWDAQNERWLAPFMMATINCSIVHRSHQLQGYPYGRAFKYDEALWMPAGTKGKAMSYAVLVGLVGFAASMTFKPSRELLNEHVLPKAGTGPCKKERDDGSFDARFIGFAANMQQVRTKVTGDKDPGYGSTCQMLAQSGLCLLQDVSRNDLPGGFYTPASAMGEKLIARLQAHTGIKFAVIPAQ